MNNSDAEQVIKAARDFFRQAIRYQDTTFESFLSSTGVKEEVILGVLSRGQWLNMRDDWLRNRARQLMDELYPKVVTRRKFSRNRLRKLLGIHRSTFDRVVGGEWYECAMRLPTGRDIVLAKVDEMVALNVPLEELTVQKVCRAAGIMAKFGPWLGDRLRLARRELAERQKNQIVEPPVGINARIFPGGWIDLDGNEWDLKVGRAPLRRDCLRSDVAKVVWPLLREELSAENLSLQTVSNHYRNFRCVCDLLGADVPDVNTARIDAVQKAWCSYVGTRPQKDGIRSALIQLFTALLAMADCGPSVNRDEMLKIIVWLRTKVKLPPQTVDRDFLSESELDHLIYCCLLDIKGGIEFSEVNPDLLNMTTRRDVLVSAAPVVNWSVALMTLLMAFTGLRHSSVTGLKVNDWMELNEELSSIVWRHMKKCEENIVFTPILLIRLLECYVRRTDKVRRALGTRRVFLTGNNIGDWITCPDRSALNQYLQGFTQRHQIMRDGYPIALSSVILRRTYATHQLYKGRSLWFIRAQFGHASISHTKDYVQFDRYEHPAQVGRALDEYGKRVLNLWHTPVDLENLHPDQRVRVFNTKEDRHTDMSLPLDDDDVSNVNTVLPCTTCDSLVTGGEFLEAWDKELIEREERLRKLEAEPELKNIYDREMNEFRNFMRNYQLVKGDKEQWAR